jgi:hypothetical protein
MPEDPENPWGVTPFRKVRFQSSLLIMTLFRVQKVPL